MTRELFVAIYFTIAILLFLYYKTIGDDRV